jgi:hypothetical protein
LASSSSASSNRGSNGAPDAFEFLLDCLSAEEVRVLAHVVHDVEVAEASERADQFATPQLAATASTCLVPDVRECVPAECFVGLELGEPVDKLFFERLGLRHRLLAGVAAAARGAVVAADAAA